MGAHVYTAAASQSMLDGPATAVTVIWASGWLAMSTISSCPALDPTCASLVCNRQLFFALVPLAVGTSVLKSTSFMSAVHYVIRFLVMSAGSGSALDEFRPSHQHLVASHRYRTCVTIIVSFFFFFFKEFFNVYPGRSAILQCLVPVAGVCQKETEQIWGPAGTADHFNEDTAPPLHTANYILLRL